METLIVYGCTLIAGGLVIALGYVVDRARADRRRNLG